MEQIVDFQEVIARTPGGAFTILWLVPVVMASIIASTTKNAAATGFTFAGALAAMMAFTESSPWLWMVVAMVAVGAVLMFMAMGWRG